jgi:tetratricopeptide (TPR) repeat protein
MARQLEASRRFPDAFQILGVQISIATYQGELARANDLAERFEAESVSKTGLNGSAASVWGNIAVGAASFGDAAAARASSRRSLALDRNIGTLLNSALAFALTGDAAGPQKIVAEAKTMALASSEDAQIGFREIEAILRLHRGDHTALDELPQPKGQNATRLQFLAGFADLTLGNPAAAARAFKQVLDDPAPSLSINRAQAPLYYARALAKLGKIDESRKAYEQFLETESHADAGLPLIVAARREYAALGR